MRNLIVTIFILFFFVLASQAQKPYSMEYLENASPQELDFYLDKALKLQKTGKTVTIVGGSILGATAATVGGVALFAEGDWALGAVVIGFFGGIAGLGTMAVGIPMKATGKKRIERINTIKNTAFDGVKIDLRPCAHDNLMTQNYQPGITLRIRF
ncbi:hypothetical protein [Sunxiuqinia sp. sy24]|uniref:hypothetical protein n=1 Tax=Sunxiuqinia sp. sy24 TaxID=3461495 RepID=UPI0040457551